MPIYDCLDETPLRPKSYSIIVRKLGYIMADQLDAL